MSKVPAITEFETNFIIMPGDCNYMIPMIFGGAFFSKMDLCAAACADRALESSECDAAVTHKFDGIFHKPTELGEMIFLRAKIVELRSKAIKIHVKAFRKKRAEVGEDFVAEANFVFVSRKNGDYHPHGLVLSTEK